jgi:transposase
MINQDVHAVFLTQISESDPNALHVIVMDQAGFHMKQEDGRVPADIRVLPLPPYCPELNPAEWFGRVVKAPTVNRIYQGSCLVWN